MKAKKYWILSAIMTIGIILSSCDNNSSEETTQKEKKHKITEGVKRLCSQYDAVTSWKQRIGKKGFLEHTFTIEVEDALIRNDGRPILFYGVANDIVKESDKYIVYWGIGLASLLRAPMSGAFGPNVRFVLESTPSQVEEIMHHSASSVSFDDYAVIAQISEVEKIRFELSSGESGEKVHVETSDVFMAKGKCLDLLLVVSKPKDEQKQ